MAPPGVVQQGALGPGLRLGGASLWEVGVEFGAVGLSVHSSGQAGRWTEMQVSRTVLGSRVCPLGAHPGIRRRESVVQHWTGPNERERDNSDNYRAAWVTASIRHKVSFKALTVPQGSATPASFPTFWCPQPFLGLWLLTSNLCLYLHWL